MNQPLPAQARLALWRAEFTRLETQLVTACEAAAGHGCRGGVPPADRGAWDRATWRRYLAAARALDAEYGPRMRRLYGEVERLRSEAALAPATLARPP